jgi:hypothetical protein
MATSGGKLLPVDPAILEAEGIRHFEEDITRQPASWIWANFSYRTVSRINLSVLVRNLIWQAYERISAGELAPLGTNIRGFWYQFVKPVLSRAGILKEGEGQYKLLSAQFMRLVVERRLFRYRDFGFMDENQALRCLGELNPHILLFAEKEGHFPILLDLHEIYDCTVVALGGQPSALSTEYLIHDLAQTTEHLLYALARAQVDLEEQFLLVSVVDYDPSGWLIMKAFRHQLTALGVPRTRLVNLVLPSLLTREELELAKFPLPRTKSMKKIVDRWLAETGGIDGKRFGFEADAVPIPRLKETFDEKVSPHLDVEPERVLRKRLLEDIIHSVQEMILVRLG